MKLLDLLRERRDELAQAWLDAIYNTYPLETVGFMRRKKDQFLNPVGDRTTSAVHEIVDAILADGLETDAVQQPLDDLVRIRGVQDFNPAQAVGVIFVLKRLVREMCAKELESAGMLRELLQFEDKIDTLALISFNIYTTCRNQIYEMRVKEVKNAQSRLLKRAGMIVGAEESDNNA